MNKKGAVELSMSTIVVVVMAIVLLSLGIVFIQGIIGKTTKLSDQAFLNADKSIQDLMGGDQAFFIAGTNFQGKVGEELNIIGGIQNFEGKDIKFELSAEGADDTSDVGWITMPTSLFAKAGDKQGFPMIVKIPKTAKSGSSHLYNIIAYDEDGEIYGNEVIAVSVK
jgi:hypothetical protein